MPANKSLNRSGGWTRKLNLKSLPAARLAQAFGCVVARDGCRVASMAGQRANDRGSDDPAATAASHFPVPDRCGSLKLRSGVERLATIGRIPLRLFGMVNFDAWIIFW